MKRITVPEPEITLYEDGFQGHDKLGREETGRKLSELVERIDEPLVIALDGGWGSGKSFFLKCWVGYHLQQEGHKAETVYFDAFKHDFLDEPLIALTDVITTRFESKNLQAPADRKARTGKIKKIAWLLGKSGLKVGASLATFGATNHLEELGDAVAEAIGEEAKTLLDSDIGDHEAETFWAEQRAKVAAMDAFKQALVALTEPATEEQAEAREGRLKKGDPSRKLVIVVDELDRCRPDYALSLLEIIKHFFNVPGVHFVLGVNLAELQNSVRARYGAGVDAAAYLHKFVSLKMPLNVRWNSRSHDGEASVHFRNTLDHLDVNEPKLGSAVYDYVMLATLSNSISLRDAEQIATKMVITPTPNNNLTNAIVAGLIVCSVLRPNWVPLIRQKRLSMAEFSSIFQFGRSPYVGPHGEGDKLLWEWFLGDNSDPEVLRGTSYLEAGRTPPNIEDFSSEVIEKYIDVFRMR